ncbi:MAG: hypothetical protein ACI9HK_001590 [Pirellulaceae bacterium]|jgi:hypothetical protein
MGTVKLRGFWFEIWVPNRDFCGPNKTSLQILYNSFVRGRGHVSLNGQVSTWRLLRTTCLKQLPTAKDRTMKNMNARIAFAWTFALLIGFSCSTSAAGRFQNRGFQDRVTQDRVVELFWTVEFIQPQLLKKRRSCTGYFTNSLIYSRHDVEGVKMFSTDIRTALSL